MRILVAEKNQKTILEPKIVESGKNALVAWFSSKNKCILSNIRPYDDAENTYTPFELVDILYSVGQIKIRADIDWDFN